MNRFPQDSGYRKYEESTDAGFGKFAFWMWWLLLAELHLILTLPLLPFPGAGNDVDERLYHYPSILQIRSHWPRLDPVADSLSATAPGYHYFLATLSEMTGSELLKIRVANDLISMLIPLFLFAWLSRYMKFSGAFVLTLPLAVNYFFLKASCRVVTDNAALLLALLSWMALFFFPARGIRGTWAGLAATLGTCVRQLNVSLAGPALLQILLDRATWLSGEKKPKISDAILPLLARLLPFGVVAYLFHVWHGPVPSQWQGINVKLSAAPAAFSLALAGIIGSLFLFSLPRFDYLGLRSRWIFAAMSLGLIISLLSPTTWSNEEGRWGGWLWLVTKHFPAYDHRSLVFIILSPVGAGIICCFTRLIWQVGRHYEACLWLCSILAWLSVFPVGTYVFQHYFEPTEFLLFAVARALIFKANANERLRSGPIWALTSYGLFMTASLYAKVFLHLGLPGA